MNLSVKEENMILKSHWDASKNKTELNPRCTNLSLDKENKDVFWHGVWTESYQLGFI